MAKIDQAASDAAFESRMGRPTDLSQSDIDALAAGGKAAEKVRKRMDSEASAPDSQAAAAANAAQDGGKSAPTVEPPQADADVDEEQID